MWLLACLCLLLGAWPLEAAGVEEEDGKWLEEVKNESYHILHCGKRYFCNRATTIDTECHCDEECGLLRDCCVDRAVRDEEVSPETLVKGVAARSWGCGRLGYSLSGIKKIASMPEMMVSMVKDCPEGHPYSSLCAGQPTEDSSNGSRYILDVSVLGATTDIWYRNIYCAACNGEVRPRPYRASLVCNYAHLDANKVMDEAEYLPRNLTWVFANGSVCNLQLTLNTNGPEHVGWLRSCPIDLVDECPIGTDPDLAEKCRSYSHFSLDRQLNEGSPMYKNQHCALCHGVKPKCVSIFLPRQQPPSGPSLTTLLDISWDLSRLEVSWNCTLPHGLWDVLHGRCISQDAACPPGLSLDGDLCVPANPNPGVEGSCVKVTLLQHEYRVLESGGVVLNSSLFAVYEGHIFEEGQFERLPNGSVAICRSLLQRVHDDLIFYSSAAQVYITIVCLSVSVACLALHIATYCLLPKLCNLPGKNLVALSWALLLGQLLLLVGIQPTFDVSHGVCVAIALALQYFFLAAFCWMNIMSLDIWRTFSSSLGHTNSARTFRKYSAYAWGVPALLSAATLAADALFDGDVAPHLASSRGVCWFGSRAGQAIFFTAPVLSVLVGNAVLFGVTVYQLHRHTRDNYRYIRRKNKEELSATLSRSSAGYPTSSPPQLPPPSSLSSTMRGGVAGSRDETRLYLYLKLFIVMGMAWIFGFLATLIDVPVLMYPFLVLNGLQGAFIFFMFDLKRSIGRMLWDRLVGRRRAVPAFLESRTSGSNNNSSSNQSVAKKKISLTSTSSSLLSSGAFRPISNIIHDRDMAAGRVSALPRPEEEAVELMGSRRSGAALLPPPGAAPWSHKLPQSEVT